MYRTVTISNKHLKSRHNLPETAVTSEMNETRSEKNWTSSTEIT